MWFLISVCIVLGIVLWMGWKRYKYKIRLYCKTYFYKRQIQVSTMVEERVETYVADDDILQSIEQFKEIASSKINNTSITSLNIVLSDYPMLVYKGLSTGSMSQLIHCLDTFTATHFPILYQFPNKLHIYINQPYLNNKSRHNQLYDFNRGLINFYPTSQSNDYINYKYIRYQGVEKFMSEFEMIVKNDLHETITKTRTLLCKLLNRHDDDLIALISHTDSRLHMLAKSCESLIVILDANDNIIYHSKHIITNPKCRPIGEVNNVSLYEDNEFASKLFTQYATSRNKRVLYVLCMVINLFNQPHSTHESDILRYLCEHIDANSFKDYYSTPFENNIYIIAQHVINSKNDSELYHLFEMCMPGMELLCSLNMLPYKSSYNFQNTDTLQVIKMLKVLQHSSNTTIILKDYSKSSAFMKLKGTRMVKEDISIETFDELKQLVFKCWKHGVKVLVVNECNTRTYFIHRQYYPLDELNHNIFPINEHNLLDELEIYKSMTRYVVFVNLDMSTNYETFFTHIIPSAYELLKHCRNYMLKLDDISCVEFNVRNPINVNIQSVWQYPTLLSKTPLFDVMGGFKGIAKFAYSVIVNGHAIENEVEKVKELFYEINMEVEMIGLV